MEASDEKPFISDPYAYLSEKQLSDEWLVDSFVGMTQNKGFDALKALFDKTLNWIIEDLDGAYKIKKPTVLNLVLLESGPAVTERALIRGISQYYKLGQIILLDMQYEDQNFSRDISDDLEALKKHHMIEDYLLLSSYEELVVHYKSELTKIAEGKKHEVRVPHMTMGIHMNTHGVLKGARDLEEQLVKGMLDRSALPIYNYGTPRGETVVRYPLPGTLPAVGGGYSYYKKLKKQYTNISHDRID